MPSLAEDYRVKASECAELATKTKDPRSKRVLEQTAEAWSALADGVESTNRREVGATERTGGRRSKPAVLGLSVAGLQLGRFRCSLPNTSPWTCSRSRLLWMCPHWAVLLVVGTPAICQRGGVSIWWGHHRIWDVAATPAQGHQENRCPPRASPERPRAWTGLRPSRGQSGGHTRWRR